MSAASSSPDRMPEVEEYAVQALPETWPSNWDPFAYAFPDVLPKFNQNRHVPPEQTGLDRLFNYLIS
jgi:hypothetical protein